MRKLVLAVLAAAVAAPAAAAGGWATVGVDSQPSGREWDATITVYRHGRTPTDGARPSITIRNDKGVTKRFEAKPVGGGKYTVHVEFPSAGTWRYAVNTGLAATGYGIDQVQTFAPVEIRGRGDDGSSIPGWPLATAAALALVLALAFFLGRRRRLTPGLAPTAQ